MRGLGIILGVAMLAGGAGSAWAQSCTDALPAVCLQTLGAGSVSASGGDASDCKTKLAAYRTCISELATQQGAANPALPPLSRAEFGFLAALEAELADNVGRLEVFVENLDLTGAKAVYENDWPPLRTRFFDATDNPAYFAAPADWLARTQAFYDDVATMLTRDDVRHAFRRQVTSVLYERKLAKERLQQLIAQGRDALLPEISATLANGR